MTESTETTPAAKGGLSAMLLPELKKVAGGLGIKATGMKKAELVAAIKAAQGGGQGGGEKRQRSARAEAQEPAAPPAEQPAQETAKDPAKDPAQDPAQEPSEKQEAKDDRGTRGSNQNNQPNQNGQNNQPNQNGQGGQRTAADQNQPAGEEEGGSRRNRRRRGRDRAAAQGQGGQQPQGGAQQGGGHQGGERRSNRNEPDLQILEDDVLAPCAGILDILDSYAFVRTSGYMPGNDDVYVSLSTVRKYGLRRGDAIVGQVRQPREGDRKEKFNPLVKIDSINGGDPEAARTRQDFGGLTPVHPTERLRMETSPTNPANTLGRVIDLVAPIGKGQRGLVVSPAKAGKTTVLQAIAQAVTTNNPECHLMVVLVDERPEEVTDFERSVNGEVISSTFDRPASDHTMVAELAIERAKRLVELGHDVVVLVDGLTRLGRAYNLSAPASGRILSGGVDSSALYPPKKFFGAARNIEDGGSLTIIATALVETGSRVDEVIFEELQDTASSELRLRRELADKQVFPTVDPVASGTRREDLLMNQEELAVVSKLRRELSELEPRRAVEQLVERLGKSQTNVELLMRLR